MVVGGTKHFLNDEAPHVLEGVTNLVEVPRHQGSSVGVDTTSVGIKTLFQCAFGFADILGFVTFPAK